MRGGEPLTAEAKLRRARAMVEALPGQVQIGEQGVRWQRFYVELRLLDAYLADALRQVEALRAELTRQPRLDPAVTGTKILALYEVVLDQPNPTPALRAAVAAMTTRKKPGP